MVASTDIMLIHRHRSFLPHLSIVPNVNTEACVSPSVVDRTISSSGCSRRHAQAVIRASRNRPQAPKPHLRHSSSPRSPNQAITMRVTPNLLSKGFLGRSLDEFKRLSVIGTSPSPPTQQQLTANQSSVKSRRHPPRNSSLHPRVLPRALVTLLM
jgi:hypothetical protein